MPCRGVDSAPEESGDDATADTMTGQRDEDGLAESWGGNDTNDYLTRHRDDSPAEYWDSETGEYRTPPKAKLSTVRSAAVKELGRGLERLGHHHG